MCGFSRTGSDRNAVVDLDAGQELAFARFGKLRCLRGVGLPKRHLASGADARERQRGAPGAGADDRDVVERHVSTAVMTLRVTAIGAL